MENKNSNAQLAYILRCVAASYTLRGIDRFRVIAYERASDVIDHLGTQLHDLWQSGSLKNIEGIGKILTERINDYFKNGENSFLMSQYYKIPTNVYLLMQVPGVGAKTAYKLITNFKLENSKDVLNDIAKQTRLNKISVLSGFGEKSQADILSSIETFQTRKYETKRMRLDQAENIFTQMVDYLSANTKIKIMYPVGSLRRFSSTVGDVDIVAVCDDKDSQEVIDYFVTHPQTAIVEGKGEHKGAIILSSGVHIQLRTTSPEKLGAMLQYNTGSKEHNIRLREYALKKGYSLSEYGIKKVPSAGYRVPSNKTRNTLHDTRYNIFDSEEKFYNFLGLQYIPPELRQGNGEIEMAKGNKIPKLIEIKDVRGDLQMHSNYPIEPSHDLGADSYEDLLDEASNLEYGYIAFTDHNPSIGNHTDQKIITILRTRQQYIDKELSKKIKRTNYFISLEVDILPDGDLAIPNGALKYLDFILISIHSSFSQPRADMTRRILRAMQNPKVRILAHPTTRKVGVRDEIDADWEIIFREAKHKNIALEINGSPERLDLPDNLIVKAHSMGCKFSLGTDSHDKSQLKNIRYCVAQARRGGLDKHAIINTMDYQSIKSYLLK